MRKIFGFLFCALVLTTRVYAEEGIPTEKQYTFDRTNVATVLAEFIEDEKLAQKAADKYNELSREGSEKISAVDFVDVCVVGGMNIKATDGSGYTKCLEMFMRLIEMQNQDIGDFNMYCPATGNALKSITDKTKIGEICGGTSDTYIEFGYVTVKALGSDNKSVKIQDIKNNKAGEHQYVCTCTPQSCKPGYHWDKNNFKCVDGKGYCDPFTLSGTYNTQSALIRSSQNDSEWDSYEKNYSNEQFSMADANATAFNKCVESVNGKSCTIRSGLAKLVSGSWTNGKYQIVCNISDSELENWQKQEMDKYKTYKEKQKKHEEELAEQARYYEVCGKDKGKGECIDDVFTRKIIGGTQVSYATGNALVKEYARVRLGDEITCGGDSYDKNIRKSGTEYYIKCKSLKDLTKYYEFKFDDLEESKDLTANTSVYNAVWHIIYNYNIAKNSHNGYDTGTKANCDAVNATFKKICNGCGTEWRESGYIETKGKKFCYDVINISDNTTCKKSSNDLNTAFDIDPFVFCKNTHNQLKNTGNLESLLKQYLSDKSGVATYSIECYPQTLCYTGSGCEGMIGHGDDIKTCVVHGDKDYTVDFVFDDVNEFSKTLTKGALQSMACVVSGGTFAGQECIMANELQCKKLASSMKDICPNCKAPKWNAKTKLCELPDAAAATQYEKNKTMAMIVGGTIVAVGVTVTTLGSGAPVVAIVLGAADIAGGVMEGISQWAIDGMAHDFLLKSIKCRDANCAERILKEDLQEMANIMNDMTDPEINATDTEFARLVGLIPQDSDFYKRIVEQGATLEDNKKGFFDPEGWNQAQFWRAIGIGLQFSSLTTGVIKKLIEAPRFANKFPKMQKVLMEEVKLAKTRYQLNVLENADKVAKENKIVCANLSDIDKEYCKLWQAYAPKNQTFYEFKERFSPSSDHWEKMGSYERKWWEAQLNGQSREYWEANGGLEMAKNWAKSNKSYTEIANAKKQFETDVDFKYWVVLKNDTEENKSFVNSTMRELLQKEEYEQWLKMSDKEKYDTRTVLNILGERADGLTVDEDLKVLKEMLPELENVEKNLSSQQLNYFQEMREALNAQQGNYSTWNPEFTIYSREMEKAFDEELNKATEVFDVEDTKLYNEYRNRFFKKNPKATEDDFKASEIYSEYKRVRLAKHDEIVGPVHYKYQVDMAEKFPLKNIDNVAEERATAWAEALNENPELKAKLENEVGWNSMTDEERLDIAQQLTNKYTDKTGLPHIDLSLKKGDFGGYYSNKKIVLNPDEQLKSGDWVTEILSHEDGHAVDDLVPNSGAIGAQKQRYINKIYSNRQDGGYYVSLTEQSSYKTGAATAKKTSGAIDAQKQRNVENLKATEGYLDDYVRDYRANSDDWWKDFTIEK